jgi:glucose/arabinose dehydrogenase
MKTVIASISIATLLFVGVAAAPASSGKAGEPAVGSIMDYGPFLASSVSEPPGVAGKGKKPSLRVGFSDKGLSIDVGNGATVCFDEDTCRMAAGWTGGLLDLSRTHMTSLKGSWDASPAGPIVFSTHIGPGWAKGGSFADSRSQNIGPLPKDWAHYKGLYRHGKQVVISYSVGNVNVLETPRSFMSGLQVLFTRTIHVDESDHPMMLHVCDVEGFPELRFDPATIPITGTSRTTTVGVVGDKTELQADGKDGHTIVNVKLAPHNAPITFVIMITVGPKGQTIQQILDAIPSSENSRKIEDPSILCYGGPSLWNPPIVTPGRLAPQAKAPYVVDTLTLPDDNPWHSWMRPSGLDFFPDGRCAVCTLNGDVWIVSGIDADLQHVTWKRFATGLYEPLGLKIVDGQLYVLGRDQITRLTDLDGDGEADFYENFNNDVPTWPAYNAFHFDLQTDSKENFWYLTSGLGEPHDVPMQASVIKVSKYGDKAEVVATGLRAANGAGMGPNDEFVCSDNQGNWTPVCRINLVKPGGFYGFNSFPPSKAELANEHKTYDAPLCWIPYEYDNSTGGQVFVTSNKWGPLQGKMLSTSYGKSRLFEVVWEECEGIIQGATIPLPMTFDSGIMRARFSPADGQLYVCGLKGWQSSAGRDGCLQRVRYTGNQVCLPTEVHVQKEGIAITFACALDPKTANDEQSFGIEQYNYRWSSKYGSSKYKVSDPNHVGADEVEVQSAKLMPDGKSVFLEISRLKPVMQMAIQIHLNAADGTPIECEIDNTINHVPGLVEPPVLTAK